MRRCEARSSSRGAAHRRATTGARERRSTRALRALLHAGGEPVPAPRRSASTSPSATTSTTSSRPDAADGLRGPRGDARSSGFGVERRGQAAFHPFFAWNDQTRGRRGAGLLTRSSGEPRRCRRGSSARGARSSYVGSEVFLSLVDAAKAPYRPDLRQLAVETTLHEPRPAAAAAARAGADRLHARLGRAGRDRSAAWPGRSPPRPSHADGDVGWRLISHLSLNYLSLVDVRTGAAKARRCASCSLYADLADAGARKQIDGVRSVTAARRSCGALPVAGPDRPSGAGWRSRSPATRRAFEGSGAFLLGAVLERFFAKYVSINSFTETVLRTVQRGEIMRWPDEAGRRKTSARPAWSADLDAAAGRAGAVRSIRLLPGAAPARVRAAATSRASARRCVRPTSRCGWARSRRWPSRRRRWRAFEPGEGGRAAAA